MSRQVLFIFFSSLFLLSLSSCKDDEGFYKGLSSDGTLPVDFEFKLPFENTRALEGSKTSFMDGDVIHIMGHFIDKNNNTTDSYGCMRMENGKFKAVDGNMLVWPDQAISGWFEAFFIAGSSGILDINGRTKETTLSSLTLQTDPLKARSEKEIAWGHSVELEFQHALTYLQIVSLDPGITDRFHFYKTDLHNIFYLEREGNGLNLKFETNEPKYISRAVSNVNEGGELTARVEYFLEPGDYSEFQLKTQNDEDYLTVNNSKTANLLPNVPYLLDIKRSQGVTIVEEKEEEWDEEGEPLDVVVEDFIRAVVNGEGYINEEGTQILEQTQNGTKLIHNVDFNFDKTYEDWDFEASIPSGLVFDGGNHYIHNLGYPLFRENLGTIQNLGLKNIKAVVVSEEHNNSGEKDMSRQGGICCYNQSGATIQNVRVKDVDFTVKVKSYDSQESHNAGCLVGSNAGTLMDIYVYGNFSLLVENEDEENDVSAAIYMGGIVGQNVATISRIRELGGSDLLTQMNVTNKCTGTIGAFYLGGVCGINSSVVDQVVLPHLEIDSRQSLGSVCFAGGLCGSLSSQASTDVASLQSSTVSGTLYGGRSQKITDNAVSYTGGIAGGVYNVSVIDCRSVCDVIGLTSDLDPDVIYCNGGAFGRIQSTQQAIENITVWGSQIEGENKYIGNFAGAVPEGQTFAKDYEPYNMLVRQIVEKNVGGEL